MLSHYLDFAILSDISKTTSNWLTSIEFGIRIKEARYACKLDTFMHNSIYYLSLIIANTDTKFVSSIEYAISSHWEF